LNKKVKLYLLVIINLIAWGYVGYKVYSALQGDDDLELDRAMVSYNKITSSEKTDSVNLILNYNDPFLKNGNFSSQKHNSRSYNNKTIDSKTKHQNASVIKTPTLSVQPPVDIKYIGLVKNNTSGSQTALLSINGKSVFVKVNDNVEGFLIQQITNESILVTKGKEKLVIKK